MCSVVLLLAVVSETLSVIGRDEISELEVWKAATEGDKES